MGIDLRQGALLSSGQTPVRQNLPVPPAIQPTGGSPVGLCTRQIYTRVLGLSPPFLALICYQAYISWVVFFLARDIFEWYRRVFWVWYSNGIGSAFFHCPPRAWSIQRCTCLRVCAFEGGYCLRGRLDTGCCLPLLLALPEYQTLLTFSKG